MATPSRPTAEECQGESQDSQSCDDSAEIKSDSVDDSRNGNSEVYLTVVAEGEGICIQNIPLNVTIGLIKEGLKKFGTIKSFTVRSVKNCCDCLVEFEEADAAERIVKVSPLLIGGHISQVEKKLPYSASISAAGPGNTERGEEVRESKDNLFRDWKKIMEVVRGTDVWKKLSYEKLHKLAQEMMGIAEEIRVVADEEKEKQMVENLREEERIKNEEEEGRQYKQSRDRSQQMKETQGVYQIQKEQEEEKEQNEKVVSKLQEEEGRQYKQSRFRSKQLTETQGVDQIQEEEEEQNEKVESKLQKEAEEKEVAQIPKEEEETKKVEGKLQEEGKEKEVDFSWTYEEIMEEHRAFEEEHDKAFTLFRKRMMKNLQDEQETVNQN